MDESSLTSAQAKNNSNINASAANLCMGGNFNQSNMENNWHVTPPRQSLNLSFQQIHNSIGETTSVMSSPHGLPMNNKNSVSFKHDYQTQEDMETASSSNNNQISSTAGASRKGGARRNAWGGISYSDLIARAILSAPESRLTLSQIYEWITTNVPYFRDKGDSNSSAGWKVSLYFLISN